ncbi:hypothetical protein DPMN_148851 [Dreissena polymorpha]|uniref:FLYWCH-type domain-containing protein n=1 Tax=Dreissena polymorpha TaxID=45954 RepID=A0A9D4FCK8_DREPO|nr:hypothetical protein DPMN_148851 [Dreissena polymorpha]
MPLLVSFNVDGTINDEPETEEDSIPPEPLAISVLEETEVVFEVIEEGTKNGKTLLVGIDGYRYFQKKALTKSVLWSCSVTSAKCRCYASVIQKGMRLLVVPTNIPINQKQHC